MRTHLSLALSLVCLAASTATFAQAAPASNTPISAADRSAVIQSLGQQLQSHYIFADAAAKTAAALAAKNAQGGYRDKNSMSTFAQALTRDLQKIGDDAHFRVRYEPGFQAPPQEDGKLPSAEQMAEERHELAGLAYGISRVQLLPGGIGYLDVRGFGPAELVGAAYDSAISLLAGTDALIIDLRQNGGGEPDGVAYLLSHFFAEGDARHFNDIYERQKNSTREFWTNPVATPRYTRPIYVLTSHDTFSGGEECAYDLKTQKRATLVGETTGGGSNPGDDFPLGHDLVAFIPTSRSINPVTKTNWEHVGVKPDLATSAGDAMKTAYLTLLNQQLAKARDPEEREALKDLVARVGSGAFQLPAYYPRQRQDTK